MTHWEKANLVEQTIKVLSQESNGQFYDDNGKQSEFYNNLREFLADQLQDWKQLKSCR